MDLNKAHRVVLAALEKAHQALGACPVSVAPWNAKQALTELRLSISAMSTHGVEAQTPRKRKAPKDGATPRPPKAARPAAKRPKQPGA
jgi:hypothetical protein